jgi:hypothetical protein
MGSMGYLLGGALAGAGQGLQKVGEQAEKEQLVQKESDLATKREETIARLKDQFEKQNIQNQQEFQLRGAAAGREFEMGKEEREHTFQHGENVSKQETELQGRRISGDARVDAAAIGAYSRSSKSTPDKNNVWTSKAINAGPAMKDDGTGKMVPDYAAPPRTVLGLVKGGRAYNPQGDRLYAWDNDKMQNLRDPKSTNRAVAPGEVEDLLRDPLGKVPDGKNAGLQKSDVFEAAHGYLPTSFTDAALRAQSAQGGGNSSTSSGYKLPSGRQFNPPPGGVAPAAGAPGADNTDND